MKVCFDIIDWYAAAPGLSSQEEWMQWAFTPAKISPLKALRKPHHLPMMTARRLSTGSRLAVEAGLALLAKSPVDAVVSTSRHGELERSFRILQKLAHQESLSPTDFAMSVHNSVVGSLTIAARFPLVSTAIAAGKDSFQQGLLEVFALLKNCRRVMLIDYDGNIPEFYLSHLPAGTPNFPYVVALILTSGQTCSCETASAVPVERAQMTLPQSLQFLHGWLSGCSRFSIAGENARWQWSC